MPISSSLSGLYAITDSELIPEIRFISTVESALLGGARVIQYRDKSSDTKKRLQQAQLLQHLCQQYDVPLIINDDWELAAQVKAAGVHLGENDGDIYQARQQLGQQAWIGASCYNDLALADKALAAGANYIAFGRFFNSNTKPNARIAEIALLSQARQKFNCPIVAIGGITPENGATLLEAGADCLAAIHGVFAHDEVKAAAEQYTHLFNEKK